MLRIQPPLASEPLRRPFPASPAAPTALLPFILTNAGLAPTHQFEAFRAAYDGIVDMAPSPERAAGYAVSQRIWPLGRCLLVAMSLPASPQPLRWTHAGHTVFDHWYAALPCRFVDGQAVPARSARAAALHSLAHPHAVTVREEGALLLFVPRGALRAARGPGIGLHGVDLDDNGLDDNGLLGLLGDLMLSLANRLPGLDDGAIAHAADAVCMLVSGAATAFTPPGPLAASTNDLSVIERARRVIRARLKDEALEPDAICRELAVSRSRLYRLFAPLGGIAAYIRRQRLMQARHALVDPFETRPIMMIAEEWGFRDPSVFSRAFRHEFGVSPRDVRGIGLGAAGAASGRPAPPAAPPSLSVLLHGLVG
ncbi:helix-turn-helix domain-containing protein [Ancylobacter sp. A5.8]|uniref:helix-turn-helix domain-containing protein n=1 Tax=Ancylobacter gelatini TaxID=2919920 RepID=UPI001F4EA2C8|nr:helix-turn-helix domain-containing protein [Ancylobacter gelatini]MCJ8142036.1 helix-turn-helix domain-containing protein [Ancylobacter gelatini]